MKRPLAVWTISFSVAIAAHLALLFALFHVEPPSGARSAGTGGLEISLRPAGSAAGAQAVEAPVSEVDAVEPDSSAPVVTAEAVETVEPVDAVEPTPVEDVREVQAETVEPVRESEVRPVDAQEAMPVVDAVEPVEETPVAVVPKVRPLPRPTPPEPSHPEAASAPAPAPAETVRPEREVAAARQRSVAGQGQSGTSDGRRTGEQSQSTGGGLPGMAPDYAALLQAWLERHKTYPQRARAGRQEGQVLLYFAMNREGRILARQIRRGSGHTILDEEALAMLERASPLPPFPAEFGQNRLELVVPVRFRLKDLR